jgi:predicted DNA-binding transcriptional regulator AlpA
MRRGSGLNSKALLTPEDLRDARQMLAWMRKTIPLGEAAKTLGLSTSVVWNWYSNGTLPTRRNLAKLKKSIFWGYFQSETVVSMPASMPASAEATYVPVPESVCQ